jgi:hypothetical protein
MTAMRTMRATAATAPAQPSIGNHDGVQDQGCPVRGSSSRPASLSSEGGRAPAALTVSTTLGKVAFQESLGCYFAALCGLSVPAREVRACSTTTTGAGSAARGSRNHTLGA